MKTWIEPQKVDLIDDLRAAVGGHRIVAESLAQRGFHDVAAAQKFLNPDLYSPTSPDELPDMDKAVDRMRRAIKEKTPILIWGDFDVDGQTSTSLLYAALRDLGAVVDYHIPNRFTEGHGIHLPTLQTKTGYGVLLTCDTGITAHESVDYAQAHGMDVVITDHHALPEILPNAHAVVNPMRLPEGHSMREFPGVGTAYQLMRALYGATPSDHLLDLVAMGIVADVMVQTDDTRYWLQRGLDILRNNPRAGLRGLMQRAEIDPTYLTEMDIGFGLAPRLNALGRLADANPAVELLTTDDPAILAERINELEGLNQKRRFLTRQVYEAAQQQIQKDDSLLKYAALVVVGEGWHTGVVGIVASRLAEDYNCPVIVLAENDGYINGSARSVDGVNIIEAIRSQANLLEGFGGHNMAAGLRMKADNLFVFRRGLSQAVREQSGQIDIEPTLNIDAYVGLDEINLDFADDLSRLAPFGNGNPPLTLATKNVRVKKRRTLGSRGDHLELRIVDENDNEQRVLWWFGNVNDLPQGNFDLAYTVRSNVFKGKREALMEWIDARPVANAAIEVEARSTYDVINYRGHPTPHTLIETVIKDYPEALIFSEGDKQVSGIHRYHMIPTETLIVWTVPPDVITWNAILNTAQPQRLILFGNYPHIANAKMLIEQVMGMGKYAQRGRDGWINLEDMVRITGQSILTLRLALRWINLSTPMQFNEIMDDLFLVATDEKRGKKDTDLLKLIDAALRETEAYRRYWLTQQFH